MVKLHGRFLALESNGGRLGNQLFHLCSGYAIARKLGRRQYIRSLKAQGFYIGGHLEKITAIFPKLVDTFIVLETRNEYRVPFAQKDGVISCCEYEDPTRLRGKTEQFLVLEIHYAQNVRYFEDMVSEIRQILQFSADVRQNGDDILRRMNIGNSSNMCAHIRRSDFVEMNVASDFNASVRDIHEIASDQGLSNVFLFGDDVNFMERLGKSLIRMDKREKREVKYSMNSEGVDLYLASKVCSAMLITAPTSTFGWWLAFFIQNQSAVFYSNDNRTMVDKTPRKDLFLMKIFVLACLASFVGATTLNNQAPRIKRSSSEGSFEEKLKEGNELLKNEPNANDTMELLRKLHNMEEEIKDDRTASEKPSPEVLKAIEDYAKTVQNHKGDSIPEINAHNKVGSALFQGDMILTKEQAEEILEDVKEDVANHKKQGTRSPE